MLRRATLPRQPALWRPYSTLLPSIYIGLGMKGQAWALRWPSVLRRMRHWGIFGPVKTPRHYGPGRMDGLN